MNYMLLIERKTGRGRGAGASARRPGAGAWRASGRSSQLAGGGEGAGAVWERPREACGDGQLGRRAEACRRTSCALFGPRFGPLRVRSSVPPPLARTFTTCSPCTRPIIRPRLSLLHDSDVSLVAAARDCIRTTSANTIPFLKGVERLWVTPLSTLSCT